MVAGIIDGDALITHRVALDDYDDAIATFRRGEGSAAYLSLKALIRSA